ncbi:MAG: type I-B CRISPR-associated protein Cas5b [Nitrososphaerota archaeon]
MRTFLAFDLWSDFAFFRRGYTTTSPLTYPFPPRTVLSGLIASILGLDWDEYYSTIETIFSKHSSLFAVQLLNPVKTFRITQNMIDTKTGYYLWDNVKKQQPPRTQIPFEYLRDPKYRIFTWFDEKSRLPDGKLVYDRLLEMLSSHKSVYTPYLGISECIAEFRFIGEFQAEEKTVQNRIAVLSILPTGAYEIEWEQGKKYGLIKMPRFMRSDRTVSEFIEFIYEKDGKPINIRGGRCYVIKGYGAIVPF